MANSKLLKEAIADAKAVKETALANAKLALEEAFTPRLQSILSQKMRAEAEEMEADDDQEATNEELDSTGIGSKVGTDAAETPGSQPSLYADTDLSVGVAKDGGKPEQSGTDYEKVADINEEDDFDFGGEEEDPNAEEIAELRARLAELEGDGGEEEENPFAATEEEDPMAMAGGEEEENPFGEEEDPYAGEEEGELGLEAIIRELEAQLGDEEGSEEEIPAEDPNAAQIAELRRQLAELEGDEEAPAEEEPKTESKKLRESRRRLKEDYTDGAVED
jgi:hypothetical protein